MGNVGAVEERNWDVQNLLVEWTCLWGRFLFSSMFSIGGRTVSNSYRAIEAIEVELLGFTSECSNEVK